jgi:hypothetical protein
MARRLPTAAARVRAQARSCGICGGQSVTGAGFPRVFRFSVPVLIPPTASKSSDATLGQIVADVPSGLSLTPPPRNKKKSAVDVQGWVATRSGSCGNSVSFNFEQSCPAACDLLVGTAMPEYRILHGIRDMAGPREKEHMKKF